MLAIALPVRAEISFTDDLGRTIELARPARRIVALYGAYAEMLLAMDLAHLLVARTDADGQITELAHLPSIGTHMRPNVELIVGLNPDLVLQMGGREQAIQSVYDLERFGTTVAFFTVDSFEKMLAVIGLLGHATGHGERSDALGRSLAERLDQVASALPVNADRPCVFFEVRAGNLLAAGTGSMVTDIIERGGGRNCIRSDGKLVRVNEEEVLRLDPDVYLIQRGPMNPAPAPLRERPRLSGLSAAINERVYEVEERMFSRPGPANVRGVEILARLLHPQSFETSTAGNQ